MVLEPIRILTSRIVNDLPTVYADGRPVRLKPPIATFTELHLERCL